MFNKSPLFRALALALVTSMSAHAAEEASDVQDQGENKAEAEERITVTGSRIKRNNLEGATPVTIITSEQIEKEGHATVFDALNTLTQTTGATQNELTQSGFTPNANVLNLRGLGPGRVLTLINGRRASDYPLPYNGQSNFVNLGSIPAAAVERIEILSGGASAIYGSDAVAGVINVVLRTNFDGDQVSFTAGKPTEGGAKTYNLEFVGGKTGDGWSLTYALEYFERGAIFAAERDFMDSYRDDPSTDDPTPVSGLRIWDRLSDEYLDFGVNDVCARWDDFEAGQWSARGPVCGYFEYPATQAIRNDDENTSAYLYGTFDFTDDLQGFFSVNAWDSKAAVASATQFWQSTYFDSGIGSFITLQRIFTPQETGGLDGLKTKFREQSLDVAAGLKGVIGNYDWDFTLSRSSYKTENERPRFLAQELTSYFLGTQQGTVSGFPVYELNMDRFLNPLSESQYLALNTLVKTDADSSSTQANFVFSGDLFEMPAGPVQFAAVLEAGSQEYDLNPDPRIAPDVSPAIVYNLTGTGGGGERDRSAVGVELSIPLMDSLTASVAGRYDKYDDDTQVDDAVTYNVGLEWRPTDSFLLRAAYATSFRAPDMHYVYAEESGFFTTVFDEFTCRDAGLTVTECGNSDADYNYSVFGVRSGDKGLEEEEGDSITYGMVWDITDELSLTVDYYKIELDGIVEDLSTSYLLQNEADCRLGQTRDGTPVNGNSAFCQFITSNVIRVASGPDAGEIDQVNIKPINAAFQSVEGIDASVSYKMDTESLGSFRYQLAWSHVLDEKFAEFEGEPRESYRDDLTNFDFRSRVRGSIGWEYGDFSTTLFGIRYGSLPNWEETGRIAPYIVYNLTARYEVTPDLAFGVAVNNVLNKRAPEDDSFFTYPFFWRAYSPIGREVFVGAEYSF